MLDTTGEFCSERQTGNVWFLAGSWVEGSVQRSCKVPVGKSIFFPIINLFYGAASNEPAEYRTDEFVRRSANNYCKDFNIDWVEIDGRQLARPSHFFTGPGGSQSPLFTAQMPPNNVLGVDDGVAPELAISPMAEYGYYLFVKPLKKGGHTLKWLASSSCGTQDISYTIHVE